MLHLQFIVLATLCGVLQSDDQVQWKQFRDFMVQYQKRYEPGDITKRFEVFKVCKHHTHMHTHINRLLGEPEASSAA